MTIATGSIVQTAWVMPDIAAGEAFLSRHFGVPAFRRMPDIHFAPEGCRYRGAPADFVAHISLAYLGDMQLELIAPVRGESLYAEFLRATPAGGLHHVAFEVDDIDAAMARAEAAGVPVVQHGTMGGMMDFAYVDGAAAGVPFIEVVRLGERIKQLFARIKASGARNPGDER